MVSVRSRLAILPKWGPVRKSVLSAIVSAARLCPTIVRFPLPAVWCAIPVSATEMAAIPIVATVVSLPVVLSAAMRTPMLRR